MNKISTLAIIIVATILLSACTPTTDNNSPAIDGIEVTAPVEQGIPSTTCAGQTDGQPVITAISPTTGMVGTDIEIQGCNLTGGEGDKQVWIQAVDGTRGVMYEKTVSTPTSITVTLKTPLCQNETHYSGLECYSWLRLIPGKYQISVMPKGKVSNTMEFTILGGGLPTETIEPIGDILSTDGIESTDGIPVKNDTPDQSISN